MNGAHLHIIVNHVSIFALVIGVVMLAISMKRKSVDLRVAASVLFMIAGVFGWISVETGEKAENILKALNAAPEIFISPHEMAAEWAQRSGILIALVAVALEWAARNKKNWVKALQWALLILAIHGCTVFARTAFLGGQIRHTEIRDSP